MLDQQTISAIKATISPARLSTYEAASAGKTDAAVLLYAWNAEVSGALLTPLHICEVVVRNAVSAALEPIYGARWPWSQSFERSLSAPVAGFNPRKDLFGARQGALTTGKVIPELKFAFWQSMFTRRHDGRVWNAHLHRVFPNLPAGSTVPATRSTIYSGLEQLRGLRNRIAHHEPIFNRNLANDYAKIVELISYRSVETARWLETIQGATPVLSKKP